MSGAQKASGRAQIRLGVAGLGRAFTLMLPTLARDPRVRLVAAADPRPAARERFATDFAAPAYATFAALCEDPQVEAVYVATPHPFHAEHVTRAAAAGKHVLVEKPMAITLDQCGAMIEATRRAGTHLVVGPSHSFDEPVALARRLVASGEFGSVRMITALNFTDFLYRPRRPEELVTGQGGGVVFSQAAHQVDIVRLLGGGQVGSVRAMTGAWDPDRPTEGAYSALLSFATGAFASLVYSGYGRFDSDEFCGWVGELGRPKDPLRYGAARAALRAAAGAEDEAALKSARTYGGRDWRADDASLPPHHEHFGWVLVSCDRADLRLTPDGVVVYADAQRELRALPPPQIPRVRVIDELYGALFENRPPIHSGEWTLATMEVCLGLLESARTGREVPLHRQVDVRG